MRDIIFKIMYDKIYDLAKKGKAGAGALVWQLLVEEVEEYSDRFSFVAWENHSTNTLITNQSCRLQSLLTDRKGDRKLHLKDSCFGQFL